LLLLRLHRLCKGGALRRRQGTRLLWRLVLRRLVLLILLLWLLVAVALLHPTLLLHLAVRRRRHVYALGGGVALCMLCIPRAIRGGIPAHTQQARNTRI
jgi:hypothetical protein